MTTLESRETKVWTGCYGSYGLWCPDSYAHPAKMSPGLCFRIFEHLKELGWLKDNPTVLDCMGRIGTTALVACSLGLKAVTVELEPKFVALQQKNKEYLKAKIYKTLDWTILQGDSRDLSQILSEKGLITVMSPPYENSDNRKVGSALIKKDGKRRFHEGWQEGYGLSAGQIGQEQSESYLSAMSQVYSEIAKVSNVLVIVLKNPTRNGKLRRLDLDTIAILEVTGWTIHCTHKATLLEENETQDLFGQKHTKVKGRMSFFKRLSYQKGHPVAQWEDVIFAIREGNGFISVTSPPYAEALMGGGINKSGYMNTGKINASYTVESHGHTHGQIGNLRDRV